VIPILSFVVVILYTLVYRSIAHSALHDLGKVDPDYHRQLGTGRALGMLNSIAAARMLFDAQIPKAFYPPRVRRKIAWARGLLYAIPAVVVVLACLIVVGR